MTVPTKGPFRDALYVRAGMEDIAMELFRHAGVEVRRSSRVYDAEPPGGVELWFDLRHDQRVERVLEVANALVAVGAAPPDGVVLTPSARMRLRDWGRL